MKMKLTALMSGMILSSSALCFSATAADKMVIAHRGASGYLPEHTLPAKAMAYAQGADYLEQDLVMTKDDRLVVLHDHYLDRVTDVAQRFPQRARKDGRFYAIDFTLDEIKSLKFTEGFEPKNGKNVQTYPGRFPMGKSDFRIHTRTCNSYQSTTVRYHRTGKYHIYLVTQCQFFLVNCITVFMNRFRLTCQRTFIHLQRIVFNQSSVSRNHIPGFQSHNIAYYNIFGINFYLLSVAYYFCHRR